MRRLHLYAGLFLLPWVFLYGITGAMFNHIGLFPSGTIHEVTASHLAESTMSDFPTPEALAQDVVASLKAAAPEAGIELRSDHQAAFNNNVVLETRASGQKYVVHIDPIGKAARIVRPPENKELAEQQALLRQIRNLKLDPNPYEKARAAVPDIFSSAGLAEPATPKPLGWCKLNFLVDIDGEPARVTYVLRDGHVDINRFTGEDGMIPRATFLKLHTFHGRTPGSSARNVWSLFLDAMAIAMVTWGVTGLIMWWQLKSLRLVGGIVIAISIATALTLYFNMEAFHALTKM